MGDLISRNALLQEFNDSGIQITFDLPVEEILGKDVDIDDFTMLVQDAIQAYKKMVIGTIMNMPTAYDVEKVVAELEQREEACIECYVEAMTEGSGGSASSFCGERWAYNNAIKIAKAGGVE